MRSILIEYLNSIMYLPEEERIKQARCYVSTFLPEYQRSEYIIDLLLDGLI